MPGRGVSNPGQLPIFLNPKLPFLLSLAAVLAGSPGQAAPPAVSFNQDIRPLLSNRCFRCHGPDEHERKGGPKNSGGLRLDTLEGVLMDLGGHQAVVPGHPEQSELLARLITHDPDDVMPPPKAGERFTSAEVERISAWIKAGAAFSKHWSYEKPVRVDPPQAGIHPVDAFILDRLGRENLKPQPEADRPTLIRRASLDLTGLPPSPEEVAAFVQDTTPEAYGRLIDRLLASPAYGEHWTRLWLDLARYADSAGYADDPSRTIWAFRDYVIRSFNENKPFDQFTVEQIAGDLLPDPTEDQLIATAFHRNTMTNSEGGTNDEEFRNAAVIDRVNTTMGVWMGTSMACAQCHTHKYDPITQAEYFKVFAFLNNTSDADHRDESPLHSFFTSEQKAERTKLEASLAALEAKFQSPAPELKAGTEAWIASWSTPMDWQTLTPAALQSAAGLTLTPEPDGTIAVAATAAKDTYTVEVPLTGNRILAALRLEALPHDSLPGHGPGHAGGNFVVTRVSAAVSPPDNSPAPAARFIRIELPGKEKLLQLAEVQVFSAGQNIAPQGVASQKSTYTDAVAARANDGNTTPQYDQNSVSHTGINTDDPWWEVDLKSLQPIDRIVVWNRAEAGERLGGFRIVALNEQRQAVWEKAGNPAEAQVAFSLSGEREIPLTDATADYVQPEFAEDAVITGTPSAKRKKPRGPQPGWAIGGSPGKAHALTLTAGAPVDLPAGSKLIVTIEQQSPHPNHTLGRFRLTTTADPRAAAWGQLPGATAQTLAIPAAQRTAAQQQELAGFYVREIAPELEPDRNLIAETKKQLEAMPQVTVPVFRDLPPDQRRKAHVQLRGNWQALGDEVTEGVPAAFHPLPPGAPADRLTLARWLVSDDNPLTPRVIANRYWEALFGIGIVRTSEEFGTQGDLPSHPELLDWLATELVRGRWDLKQFLKLLVTSSTYRQSSKVEPGMAERDPDNRLLARGPRLRLSAEMVRDQALAVSGLLSHKMYGPSVRPARPNRGLSAAFGGGLDWQTSTGEDRVRRGLYTEWRRTSPYPSMTTFDAPSRETCTLRRSQTNTPLQALVTLNDPVFVETAQALARRLTGKSAPPEEVLQNAFLLVLSRSPSDRETQRLLTLREEALAVYRQDAKKAMEMATDPIGPVPPGADPAELAAWTAVANVLLNLDETLMKR